jgi:hypothetical protein
MEWHLVLMIWGDKYPDGDVNRIIRGAMARAKNCKSVVVLTDRTDRKIDAVARQVLIDPEFDRPEFKKGGLAVKLSMFDIEAVPQGATCIYLDLDSVVVGNLDRLAALSARAPIWTIPVFPRPFSAFYRMLWRVTGRRVYAIGNSSAFVYSNGFAGNPKEQFLDLVRSDRLPRTLRHDDRFVGWSCQDRVRGLSINDVVNFRFEFLAPTLWLSDVFSILRRRARQRIVAITFAGPKTKPERLAGLSDGEIIEDHHGRRGRWNAFHTGGLKPLILEEIARGRGGPR